MSLFQYTFINEIEDTYDFVIMEPKKKWNGFKKKDFTTIIFSYLQNIIIRLHMCTFVYAYYIKWVIRLITINYN